MRTALGSAQTAEYPCAKRLFGIIVCILFASVVFSSIAAGPYPEPLANSKEIRAAKPTLDYVDIRYLSLEDYPLLSKFSGLNRIRFYNREGKGATDKKLKALSGIGFTNLIYLDLNNCRPVTDKGIETLSKIESLKELQLEGTAITDAACSLMAKNMRLENVNVANCGGVTKAGLSALAKSESLKEFRFSVGGMTPDQVLSLIEFFRSIAWCEIIDPEHKLDTAVIKKKAAEKKIHVSVRSTGALQDMRLKP